MMQRPLFGLIAIVLAVMSALAPFPFVSQTALAGDEGFDDPVLIIGPARVHVNHTVWVSDVDALKDKAIWTVTLPEGVYIEALPHDGALFKKNKVKIERQGKVMADGSIPVKVELEVPVRKSPVTDLTLIVDLPNGQQLVVNGSGGNPIRAQVEYTVTGRESSIVL